MTLDQEQDLDDQDTSTLLMLEEVAARLKVSRRSVDRYIKAGLLIVIRLSPRKQRVSQSDLDDFINRMRQHKS